MERTASTILSNMEIRVAFTRAISSSLPRIIQTKSKSFLVSNSYRMQESESNSSESIRPMWKEYFSFTLTGHPDESLIFEIFRHNSSEGALQLDLFEIKPREDPTLLE